VDDMAVDDGVCKCAEGNEGDPF